ncbi:hypothetical protein ACLOJK_004022 [Asimina triloba]
MILLSFLQAFHSVVRAPQGRKMATTRLKLEEAAGDAISRIRFAPHSNNLLFSSWDAVSTSSLCISPSPGLVSPFKNERRGGREAAITTCTTDTLGLVVDQQKQLKPTLSALDLPGIVFEGSANL